MLIEQVTGALADEHLPHVSVRDSREAQHTPEADEVARVGIVLNVGDTSGLGRLGRSCAEIDH